jgi:ArsR family transcriptional regulator
MKTPAALAALRALGHAHRLAIFRLLLRRGSAGLAAGAIAVRNGIAASSLTFHIQILQRTGLLTRRRAGRQLIYAVHFAVMNGLIEYLTENCCLEDQGRALDCMARVPAARRGPARQPRPNL